MLRFLIYCDGGFGNRFNCMISGLVAADCLGYKAEICWPANNWCEAEYSDLFEGPASIRTENLIDFIGTAQNYLVFSHDLRNAEYLSVPFVSAYNFSSHQEFKEYCVQDGRDVFYYPALIPQWLPQEQLKSVVKRISFKKELLEQVEAFLTSGAIKQPFYGIHLRRTDLVLGFTDAEVCSLVEKHPADLFFVCSDSSVSEKALSCNPNVRVRVKEAYVERKVDGGNWTDITLDDSQRPYHSNIKRNAQSVKDAVIDLLILSRSKIVGQTGSTFLNLARMLHNYLSLEEADTLPEILTVPIEEAFRKAAVGILDLPQALVAAQQLADEQKNGQAVALLRLWLKNANSHQLYIVYYNMAVYLIQDGALNEAECSLRQAVYLQPLLLTAQLQLGLILEHLNRPAEAVTQWLKALELTKENISKEDAATRSIIAAHVMRLVQ